MPDAAELAREDVDLRRALGLPDLELQPSQAFMAVMFRYKCPARDTREHLAMLVPVADVAGFHTAADQVQGSFRAEVFVNGVMPELFVAAHYLPALLPEARTPVPSLIPACRILHGNTTPPVPRV